MGYLRAHWLGQQTLVWSFWINLAVPFLVINALAQFIRPPYVERTSTFALLAGTYLILGCLAVYPWQLVGVMRACDRYLVDNRGTAWTTAIQRVTAIQGAITASLAVIVVTVFSLVQIGINWYGPSHPSVSDEGPGYTIEFIAEGNLIRFEGNFETGLSSDLKKLLAEKHDVRGIVLNSDGGRVFEARGVAKLIREHQLETYVYGMCRSACTTAFIAGMRRYLGEDGRLGFHSYRLRTVLPAIDVAAEQEKDRALYQAQGVAPTLLSRIFDAPHESMWYPEVKELLRAKVVHQIAHTEAE